MFQSPSDRGGSVPKADSYSKEEIEAAFQSPSDRGGSVPNGCRLSCRRTALTSFQSPSDRGGSVPNVFLLGANGDFVNLFQSPSDRGGIVPSSLNLPLPINNIEYTFRAPDKATLFFRLGVHPFRLQFPPTIPSVRSIASAHLPPPKAHFPNRPRPLKTNLQDPILPSHLRMSSRSASRQGEKMHPSPDPPLAHRLERQNTCT